MARKSLNKAMNRVRLTYPKHARRRMGMKVHQHVDDTTQRMWHINNDRLMRDAIPAAIPMGWLSAVSLG